MNQKNIHQFEVYLNDHLHELFPEDMEYRYIRVFENPDKDARPPRTSEDVVLEQKLLDDKIKELDKWYKWWYTREEINHLLEEIVELYGEYEQLKTQETDEYYRSQISRNRFKNE